MGIVVGILCCYFNEMGIYNHYIVGQLDGHCFDTDFNTEKGICYCDLNNLQQFSLFDG